MNRSSRRTLLTVRERVLLHLLPYHRYHQDTDAPRAVTQEGIAQGTMVGRNNIAKVVTSLDREGFVRTQTKHVKGLPSIRKVYFLTHQGFQDALTLRRYVESVVIDITKMDGVRVEEELGKLPMYLPQQYPFLELAMGVRYGRFDCKGFHEGKLKEERRFVDFTDRKPTIRAFFGRERELERISDFMMSEAKLMSVQGIAGIGKTSLLAKFALERHDHVNIFWFNVHEWIDAQAFLQPLGEFLSRLGKRGLEWYLAKNGAVNIGEVSHLLENEMSEISALLIIDDVQKANRATAEFLSALMGVAEAVPQMKMLCSSREVPKFYSRSAVARGIVQEISLEGLDKESSYTMMRHRLLPEGSLESLYRITNGHPLFLELVEAPGQVLGRNVRMFLELEVYAKLDVSERHILEMASIFRYPVPIDALFFIEEAVSRDQDSGNWANSGGAVDYDAIECLMCKSLLMESTGRTASMHDVLREFFYSRMAPRVRLALHRAAASYLQNRHSVSCDLEAMYHSLQANDCVTAVRIAAGSGEEIISKGLANLLSPLLDDLLFRCGGMDDSDRIEILMLYAEAKDTQGEWDQALHRYEDIISLTTPDRDKRIQAEVCRRLGVLKLRRSSYDEAWEWMVLAKDIAESIPDQHTLARVLYDMGGVMEMKGSIPQAIDLFQRSESQASQIGDDLYRGLALYGQARTYAQLRDYERAIALKREALEALQRTGSANEIAKVCSSLGNDLRNEGLMHEAIKVLQRSMELAESVGDLNTLCHVVANLAVYYIEANDLDRAKDLLDQAQQMSMKLDEHFLAASLHLYRGYLYHKRKEWESAKESFVLGLNELRILHVPTRFSIWLYEIGVIFLENGDMGGASALLREAKEIAASTGQVALLRKIDEVLLMLE